MTRRSLTEREEEAWTVLHAFAQCLPTVMEQQLKRDSELGYYDYAVLLTLYRAPGHTMAMSDLAESTAATLSRLSHAATRLELRDLIDRDQRGPRRFVTLTGHGRRVFLAAAAGHVDHIRSKVLDFIPPELLHPLIDALGPVVSGLRAEMPRQ